MERVTTSIYRVLELQASQVWTLIDQGVDVILKVTAVVVLVIP